MAADRSMEEKAWSIVAAAREWYQYVPEPGDPDYEDASGALYDAVNAYEEANGGGPCLPEAPDDGLYYVEYDPPRGVTFKWAIKDRRSHRSVGGAWTKDVANSMCRVLNIHGSPGAD